MWPDEGMGGRSKSPIEFSGAVAPAIVREHPFNPDAVVFEEGLGSLLEAGGGDATFIGQHL
jgi:hypothetical protein